MTFKGFRAIGAVFDCEHLTPHETLLAVYYARRANKAGEAWPGLVRIQLDTRLSRNGIRKLRDRLPFLVPVLDDKGVQIRRHRCPVYRFDVAKLRALKGPPGAPLPDVKKGPPRAPVKGPPRAPEQASMGPPRAPSRVHPVHPKGPPGAPEEINPSVTPQEQRADKSAGPVQPALDLTGPEPVPTRTPFQVVVDHWRAQWLKRRDSHTGKTPGMPKRSTLHAESNPQLEACLRRKDPLTGKPYTAKRLCGLVDWAFWAPDASYMRGEASWMTSKGHLLGLSSLFRHRDGKLEERLDKYDTWAASGAHKVAGHGKFTPDNPEPHDEAAGWAALDNL